MEFYHDDALLDGLTWLLRDELPWPIDENEMPKFPAVLGKLPPGIARHIVCEIRENLQGTSHAANQSPAVRHGLALGAAVGLDAASAGEWLRDEEIELLHAACRCWASCTDSMYQFWGGEELKVAATFGWADVVDTLEQNQVLIRGLLQWDTGRMHLGTFAQRLSLVSPGAYAAAQVGRARDANRCRIRGKRVVESDSAGDWHRS